MTKGFKATFKLRKQANPAAAALGATWNLGSGAYNKILGLASVAFPLTAMSIGYGAAKAQSPSLITDKKITDRELEFNALVTEIATARRKLQELRDEQAAQMTKRRIYDKASGSGITV